MAQSRQAVESQISSCNTQIRNKETEKAAVERQVERLSAAISKLKIYKDAYADDRDGFNRAYITNDWEWQGSTRVSFINQSITPNVEHAYDAGVNRLGECIDQLEKKKKQLQTEVSSLGGWIQRLRYELGNLHSLLKSLID